MEFRSNSELNGEEIIKIFIESCLHSVGNKRVEWNAAVVCVSLVTMLNGSKIVIIWKNSLRRHAEDGIVNFVEENRGKIRSVKTFGKYSPCSKPDFDCCSKIRETKEKLMEDGVEEVNFVFVFSAFYNINRPSCFQRGCFSGGNDGHRPTDECDGGLKSLISLGTSLRSFLTADWAELVEILSLWDSHCGVAAAGLALIRFGEKYGHWRDFEDAELKRDFEILKNRFCAEEKRKENALRNFDVTIIENEICKLKEALAKFH